MDFPIFSTKVCEKNDSNLFMAFSNSTFSLSPAERYDNLVIEKGLINPSMVQIGKKYRKYFLKGLEIR